MRPGFHWVHQWSFCSLARALASLGTSVVGGFNSVRSGGRLVHSRSLGSLAYTLRSRSVHLRSLARAFGSVWFIWGCSVHSRAPWRSMGSLANAPGVAGFMRDRWVHSCSPLGWMCSSMVVSFNWVYSCVRRVHPGYLRSLRSR